MTVETLKQKLDAGEDIFLLDVRQPDEHSFVNIGGTLIPLPELPEKIDQLDRTRDIVVYCRSGARSASAVAFLKREGFPNVQNLDGGILAWSDKIDPSKPKY